MTVAGIRSTAPRQTGLKGLAGALGFLCLVLFLLAIEQKQAVAAWAAIRDDAAPAARRVADWAGQLVSGEGEILADLIVAAHADAKRKLDEANGALMREAAGPMAGMNIPGMPKLF